MHLSVGRRALHDHLYVWFGFKTTLFKENYYEKALKIMLLKMKYKHISCSLNKEVA